jgi:nitroreductase
MANSRPAATGTMTDTLSAYLKTRRSIPAQQLADPGPDAGTLSEMLTIAARVPDHGKLAPWRFIVYSREDREKAVEGLGAIARGNGAADGEQRALKASGFAEAPLVVAVVSAPIVEHPKIPLWEQGLSAGAVCLNLVHAAHAKGFAAQWLTGWFAYDHDALRLLGVGDGERIAGFIYIGTPTMPPTERDRPDVAAKTSYWRPEA